MFAVISMQVAATLAIIASLLMMIVILRLDLAKRLFMKLVFYIAFSDLCSSIGIVIGGVKTGSAACYYQGIINNYFTLASVLWTIVIGYEVHLVIWYNRVQTNLTYFAFINWTLPLILSLVPLSTSTYGNDDGTPGWCFLNSKPSSPDWVEFFWYLAAFYFWIYLAIFYLLYVTILAVYKLYYLQRGMITSARTVVEKIVYFPIIVVMCWFVTSVVDIGDVCGYNWHVDKSNLIEVFFTYVLPNLQGFFSGVMFFYSNKQLIKIFYEEVKENGWLALPKPTPRNESNDSIMSSIMSSLYLTQPDVISKVIASNLVMVMNPSDSTVDMNQANINIDNRFSAYRSNSVSRRSAVNLSAKEEQQLGSNHRQSSSNVTLQAVGEHNGQKRVSTTRRESGGNLRVSFTNRRGSDLSNADVESNRSSEIEMNDRSSSFIQPRQPSNVGLDYGAWDDHGENDSFDASNNHGHEHEHTNDGFSTMDVESPNGSDLVGGKASSSAVSASSKRLSIKGTTMLNTIIEDDDSGDMMDDDDIEEGTINPMQQS